MHKNDGVITYNKLMDEFAIIGFAVAGGALPALAWLWFWHREDRKNPEPRAMIALAFLAGMVAVALVIPIQKSMIGLIGAGMPLFAAWSLIEEIVKYAVARVTVLRSAAADEPIDMVMYMVTVALGFAAVENALFLINPLTGGDLVQTILTGNLRFIGATLLHVVSSATVGIALALAFYKPKRIKRWYALWGVVLAILLHTGFNFLILGVRDEHLFRVFALVWVGVVIVLAILEIVKRIRRTSGNRNKL